jgi:hypothetical protein
MVVAYSSLTGMSPRCTEPYRMNPSRVSLLRGLLVGILLMPFCCFWAQDQAIDRIFSLMVPPVAITMVVAAFSACPRQAFVRRRPGTIAA